MDVLAHEIAHHHQVSLSKISLGDGENGLFNDWYMLSPAEQEQRRLRYFSIKTEIDAFARQSVHECLSKYTKEDIELALNNNNWNFLSAASRRFKNYNIRFNYKDKPEKFNIFKRFVKAFIYFLDLDKGNYYKSND